jgi:membrane-bound serine protease (ClpP class)
MLMMLGFFGILFELYNPGAILPGIVGVIALILSMYSMHSLPVNYACLGLIVFAIALFLLEIKIVSHGLLAAGGIVSLLLGSMMLVHSSSALESADIPMSIIIAATTVTALFFLFVIGLGLKSQRLKVVTGVEAMTGAEGETLTILDPVGRVKTDGEVWNAISVSGNIPVGEKIRIRAIKDMTLYVEQINTEYSGSKN